MVKYLLKLGEDPEELRTSFGEFKTKTMSEWVRAIWESTKESEELDPKEHKWLLERYGTDIKESDYEQSPEEEKKEAGPKFDKKEIF